MIRKVLLLWCAILALAAWAVGGAVLLAPVDAASNLVITSIDCQSHPRKIAIQNQGDTAQSLAGWKLKSNQPDEVFDLGVAGSLAAGKNLYVFNGHTAPLAPQQVGDEWIYGWNANDTFNPDDFVLWDDGTDFVQLVDAAGNEVSWKGCSLTPPTPVPQPTQGTQPQPTQQSSDQSGPGSDSGPTPAAGQQGATQTQSGSQSATGSQSGNTTQQTQRGDGSQNTGGEVLGPPAPGEEAPLPSGGGRPLAEESLPPALASIVAGAVLFLLGGLVIRFAVKHPG